MDKGVLVTHGNGQCPLNKDWTVDCNRSPVMVQSWIWTWDSIKSNFKRIFSVNLYKKPTSNFKINSTSKMYCTSFVRTFAKWLLTFQEWLTNKEPHQISTALRGKDADPCDTNAYLGWKVCFYRSSSQAWRGANSWREGLFGVQCSTHFLLKTTVFLV